MNDRERLVELLKAKYDHYCDQCGVNKQTDYIENLADHLIANGVTIQKHGRWINIPSSDMVTGKAFECSECKKMRFGSFKPNYCPNCGAKMQDG